MAGIVIVTEADFVASATDAAVSVTVRLLASELGGVYVVVAPLAVEFGETLPHGAAEQETVHVTPTFAESFMTIAANCAVAPSSTVALVSESEILMAPLPPEPEPPPLAALLVPILPPALHPEITAANSKTKTIPASDEHFLSAMAFPLIPALRVHVSGHWSLSERFHSALGGLIFLPSTVMTFGTLVPLGNTRDV